MKKTFAAWLITGALSTLTMLAADQPPSGRREPDRGPRPQGDFQAPDRGRMPGLDERQRQMFQEAMQKEGGKLRGLEEKMRAAQKEFLQASLNSPYDEKVARTKAEAMAAIQVEMNLVRAAALAAVASDLKPEQKQQITESPFGMAILNPGGGPRGGFPNPGRGGPPDNGFPVRGRDQAPRER